MDLEEAFSRLNISVDLIPVGSSNRPGTSIQPTHITIHNTANSDPGADAAMHAVYVKGADARRRKVSWHFTVDDRQCFKHLPTNELAWHAGAGNERSVAIEVCQNQGINKAAAMERASLLAAVLMSFYGIPPERVVTHQFWTGKDCPEVILREPGGFQAFRQRARNFLDQLARPESASPEANDIIDPLGVPEAAPEVVQPEAIGTLEERVARLEYLVAQLTAENSALQNQLLEAE